MSIRRHPPERFHAPRRQAVRARTANAAVVNAVPMRAATTRGAGPGTTAIRAAAVIAILVVALTLVASPVHADTFVVTSVAATGPGTLHQAITEANDSTGADVIAFNIASGPFVIVPTGLPVITDEVTIDGYTQPGSMPNTAPHMLGTNMNVVIEIDGSGLGPGGVALTIAAQKCTIKGLSIYHCDGAAILIDGDYKGSRIEGNILGTDNTGTVAPGNDSGVEINGAPDCRVGGVAVEARNWIVGETQGAFAGRYGVYIHGAGATGNDVWNNQIGTDRTGTLVMGGFGIAGVHIEDANNNNIGGAGETYRNIIVGASLYGVSVAGGSGNAIQGNHIGVGIAGTEMLGNDVAGVLLSADASDVGGVNAGEGNRIGFNRGFGVSVVSGVDNSILGNAIAGNGTLNGSGLGIDLAGDGVTNNDFLDWDSGPNNLQNRPVLVDAAVDFTGRLVVSGYLQSSASSDYRIEFFVVSACDASGSGEGGTYLGAMEVTTRAFGRATFDYNLPFSGVSSAEHITATATRLNDGKATIASTSEFSECHAVREIPFGIVRDITTILNGSLMSFAVQLTNLGPGEMQNVDAFFVDLPDECIDIGDIIYFGTLLEGQSSSGNGTIDVELSGCGEESFIVPLVVAFDNPQTAQRDSVTYAVLVEPDPAVPDNVEIALPEGNGIASRVHTIQQNGWQPLRVGGEVQLPNGVWRAAVWTRTPSQWVRTLLPPLVAGQDAAVLSITGEQVNDITGEQVNDIFAVGYANDAGGNRNAVIWIKDGGNPWSIEVIPTTYATPSEASGIIETSDGIYVTGTVTQNGSSVGAWWYFSWAWDFDLDGFTNGLFCWDTADQPYYSPAVVMGEMDLQVDGQPESFVVSGGSRELGALDVPAIVTTQIGAGFTDIAHIDLPLPLNQEGGEVQAGNTATNTFAGVVWDMNGAQSLVLYDYDEQDHWNVTTLPDPVPDMIAATVTGIGGEQGAGPVIVGYATTPAGTVPFMYRQHSVAGWIPAVPNFAGDGLSARRIMGVDVKGRMVADGIAGIGPAPAPALVPATGSFTVPTTGSSIVPAMGSSIVSATRGGTIPAGGGLHPASTLPDTSHAMFITLDTPVGVIERPVAEPSGIDITAYPNPFNPRVTIAFTTPQSARTVVKVYDVRGAHVATLFDGPTGAGAHNVSWRGVNARGVPVATGIYFARVQAEGHAATRKLVLLK